MTGHPSYIVVGGGGLLIVHQLCPKSVAGVIEGTHGEGVGYPDHGQGGGKVETKE